MPQPQPAIEIRPVSDLAGMEALKPAWNELLMAAIRPTVFAAWEWQYLCAKHLAEGKDILVLAVYDGDTLSAVLPLHRQKTKLGGIIPTEVFACLGGDITDYNVLLVREKYLSAVIPALAEHLQKTGLALDLRNVLPGTPLHIIKQYLAKNGYRYVEYENKIALYTALGDDYASFLETRSQGFRRNLKRKQNFMDRDGGYSFHIEPSDAALLDALIRLHTTRWNIKNQSGALAHGAILAFHTELQKMPDIPFNIRYYVIRHGKDTVALLYGFIFRRCYYYYLSGFDLDYNKISPGFMVIDFAIRALIKSGIVAFDMLRGDMHYKQSWSTGSMEMRDVILFPPSLHGRAQYLSTAILQAIKHMIPKRIKKGLKSAVSSSIFP